MIPRHDVLIIGAGVVGCSIAFHLTRRGVTRVAIVEREHVPGTGSTSKAKRLAAMEKAVAFQRSLGVPVDLLDRDDALRLAPFVEGSGIHESMVL